VEDPASQVTLEEARFEDSDFQVGDVLEEEVPFEAFGRTAVQAAKQRIIQRVREGERARIREEFSDKVGELLSGEVQQIERGKIVVMLAKFREAEAIIPYREQNHREHFHQGDTIRAVLKRIEETPKGPRLILSRADPLFVKALFKLEVPEIQQQIVEIRATAGEAGPLFAPLPPEEEAATKVSLRELKGLPVELVDVLERAGKKTLQDILDLEREDVDKIAGMTPELADKLMTFLNEMMEEGGEE